jgi:hypothetical protein
MFAKRPSWMADASTATRKGMQLRWLKQLLAGFKDPVRRPRMIIWMAVSVIVTVALMVPTLAITSTRWFCSNGCHKVQDDTIKAYEHSAHSQVDCLKCHMPVNASPLVFLAHKMEAVGELAQAVTNTYELPINGSNEVSLKMPAEQCTQCHDLTKRKPTPRKGYKIDHQVHADEGIACPTCHNRIAHKEDFQLTLIDPKTGKTNRKHADFMAMTACFRCHSQDPEKGKPAGDCALCHTPGFHLKPASHQDPGFFPKGHGKLAAAEETRAPWLTAAESTTAPEVAMHSEATTASRATTASEAKTASSTGKAETGTAPATEAAEEELKEVDQVNLCSTCHARHFCTDCHGVAMPHPAEIKKTHGEIGHANASVCSKCHGLASTMCGGCHHGTHLGYQIDARKSWLQQHPLAMRKAGPASCVQVGGCHSPTFCAKCHANGGKPPAGSAKL